jgi:hypothetical protein
MTLMIGPGVPVPVPSEVLDALDSVTVESASGDTQSGFELSFSLDRNSPLTLLFLLTGGSMLPIVRVVIAVTLRGSTTVLMDGVMTNHEIRVGSGDTSTLVIKGKDLTALMDIIELSGLPYPAMPEPIRALAILAKYAVLGCVPMVIPSIVTDVPIPLERIPSQQGSDFVYLKSMARDVGWTFYVDPGPTPGVSIAYWGPEIRVGVPQPALSADVDAPDNNVSDLSFSFDKETKEMPVVYIQEPITKAPIPIPIPDITPMSPPLGAVPPLPPKITFMKETAKLSPITAVVKGMAYAAAHSDAVSVSGSLDVARYGNVLGSRKLVGVRGAGMAFDGLYFVKNVTTSIKRGQIKQQFRLARGGLLPTVPAVPT